MLTDTTPDSLFWARIFNIDFLELEDPLAIWSSPAAAAAGGGGGVESTGGSDDDGFGEWGAE